MAFFRSEYADWRPGIGALLQPVPFPEEALATKEVQQSVLLYVVRRLRIETINNKGISVWLLSEL